MPIPGEKLVERLWETVAEKGVGSLLKPWQIRREGKAQLEVRRDELLVLAQASKDADDIREGRARLLSSGVVVPTEELEAVDTLLARPSYQKLVSSVTDALVADAVRTEVNVAKALLQAETVLASDEQAVPYKRIDDDWLFRWRDSAGAVCHEDLQGLWGRVLAGEVKAPGSISLRTLEFLRNVSEDEARGFERLAQVVITRFILRDDELLKEAGIDFSLLLWMQDLGVLSGVESIGLSMTLKTTRPGSYVLLLPAGSRGILVTHVDEARELVLPIYQLSTIGLQLMRITGYQALESALRNLGTRICAQQFNASLVRCADAGNGQTRYWDAQDLCPSTSNQPSATTS